MENEKKIIPKEILVKLEQENKKDELKKYKREINTMLMDRFEPVLKRLADS